MKIAEAFVEIRTDTKQAEGEVRKQAKSLGESFAQIFGAVAFGAGIKKAIDKASDLNETVSKSKIIFGEASKSVEQMADRAAKAMGMSKQAYLDAASGLKGLLDNLGLASDQSTQWSQDLVALGGDLASFFNTDPADAIDAISSALRGETEPIRRYNVQLSDTAVKAKAMEMGLYDGKGQIDANAKATASLKLITEQTAAAHGDFARTADGVANKERIAKAETDNAAASMGQSLLPVYERAVEVVGFLAEKFGALPAPLQLAIVGLMGVAALAGPISSLKGAIEGAITAVQEMSATSQTALGVVGALAAIVTIVAIAWSSFSDEQSAAEKAASKMTDSVTGATSSLDIQKLALLDAAAAAREYGDALFADVDKRTRDYIAKHPAIVAAMKGTGITMDDMTRAARDQGDALELLAKVQRMAADNGYELDLSAQTISNSAPELERQLWVLAKNLQDYGDAAGLSTEQLVELARVGDTAAIAALKAGGNWDELTKAEQVQAQAALDAAAATKEHGDAADTAAGQADTLKGSLYDLDAAFATLLGTLDQHDAYRGAMDSLDAVGKAWEALWDKKDTRSQAEKERAYQEAVDQSKRDLIDYAKSLGDIPPEQVTTLLADVDKMSIEKVRAALDALSAAHSVQFYAVEKGYQSKNTNALGGFKALAVGGVVSNPTRALVGEAGPEVVLPLTNASRLAELLGDPRVAGPVAAAMGGSGTATSSASPGLSIANLTVGSRQDFADLRAMLDRLMWRFA